MSGRAGRSGGHNRKSLAEHQLAGTYKPSRHAHLLPPAGNVIPMPSPAADWRPSDRERAELMPLAIDRLDAVLAAYQFSEMDGRALLDALRTLSTLAAIDAQLWKAGVTDADGPSPLLRERDRAARLFAQQWALLGLEKAR